VFKRIIGHGLSSIVFYSGIFYLARFLSSRIENTAVILCYHRVVEGTPDFCSSYGTQVALSRFKRQLRVFSRLFSFVRFSDLVDQIKTKRIGLNCFALTFDDGFMDSYTNVFTVLKEYGLPAMFFVSPEMLESSTLLWQNEPWYLMNNAHHRKTFQWGGSEWDVTSEAQRVEANTTIRKSLFESRPRERDKILTEIRSELGSGSQTSAGKRLMLSADEIAQMKTSGLVELGAHSMTHTFLSKCTEEELDYEIRQSKNDLEAVWKQEVTYFAYPFGDYTVSSVESLKKNGYTAAVTLDDGLVKGGDDLLLLKRISVVRDDTVPLILIKKILPFYLKHIINRVKEAFHGNRKG
jgi:peptidoglycan/xylan/chitin deacetylase (PgdA/CDA1 family)